MSLRMSAVRLVIRLKLAAQRLGVVRRADVYVGCAGEWRYPSFLLPSLRFCGYRRIEVRVEDAVMAWSADGRRNFLLRTRLVREAADVTAPVVVARDPSVVPGERRARVPVSADWFSSEARAQGIVMPYFSHPALRQLEPELGSLASAGPRPVRIGFAGTIADDTYREAFAFPMPTRSDVFDVVLGRFHDRIAFVGARSELETLDPSLTPIVLAVVRDPSDTVAKHVATGRDYLAFLGSSSFFLAPPGYRMPLCHNLVESMSVGAVPILGYADWLPEPLRDGVDCLSFRTGAELETAVERALAMDEAEVARLREGVAAYYAEHLSVASFARRLSLAIDEERTIVVNSERETVALWSERQRGRIDRGAR